MWENSAPLASMWSNRAPLASHLVRLAPPSRAPLNSVPTRFECDKSILRQIQSAKLKPRKMFCAQHCACEGGPGGEAGLHRGSYSLAPPMQFHQTHVHHRVAVLSRRLRVGDSDYLVDMRCVRRAQRQPWRPIREAGRLAPRRFPERAGATRGFRCKTRVVRHCSQEKWSSHRRRARLQAMRLERLAARDYRVTQNLPQTYCPPFPLWRKHSNFCVFISIILGIWL